jgi:xylulokinase
MGNFSCSIGIDAGTTSIKGVLLSNTGDLLANAGEEYALELGPNDSCELDPEIYWDITCRVIRILLDKSGISPADIHGISFSSQGETLIVIDANGKPLRKAIIWLDNRSVKEAKEIEEKFGNHDILKITGQPEVVPTWTATRILWLRKHEPFVFDNARWFLLVEDYLIFKMTGKLHTEHSLASSTLYFDINKKTWWTEMLDFLKISANQLPQLNPSGRSVGNVSPEVSLATGLSSLTQCVTGAYDHAAGAIGAGNISSGDVTLTIGASMAMCVAMDNPICDPAMKLPCQCHAVNGLYFLLPYGQTAGLVLKWFRDEFCREEIRLAEQQKTDPYELIDGLAEKINPGSDGLIMLPHLMGAGSPEFNPTAKGVFAGITLGMSKGHFIRAILESIVYMINRNLHILRQKEIFIRNIHMLGGGSRSNLWNHILSDMSGLPVITLTNTDNAALGAAILAGVGIGIFKDLKTGCQAAVKTRALFTPDPVNTEKYSRNYGKYLQLYELLEKFW